MSTPTPHAEKGNRLMLTEASDRHLGELSVDMQAFFEFSFWMAEELEELVAKHQHAARNVRKTAR